MSRKNTVLILGILVSAYFFVQPNFGFRSINNAFSFGQNVVPLIIYLETIFLARGFIKNFVSKRPVLLEKLKYFAPRRILFPFYKIDTHHFLTEKWWFRLLIVLYSIGATILLFSIWSNFSSSSWGWCYDSLYLYVGNDAESSQHFNQCREIWKESFAWVTLGGLASVAIIHYIAQFIFFKVIINFIILGGKGSRK